MKFKRLIAIIMLLTFLISGLSPAAVYAEETGDGDTTTDTTSAEPQYADTLSKLGFRFNDKVLSQIIEFTYNGEPFKTPDSYVRDSTIPFVPLYYRVSEFLGIGSKYKILTLDRLLNNPWAAVDTGIYIDTGKKTYVKISGLNDLSLDNISGTFNSAVFNAQYSKYGDNLIKDNSGGIKDLIVGIDYYGNIVTNNKQIIIPFYNNPIIVNMASGTTNESNDAFLSTGALGKILSPTGSDEKKEQTIDSLIQSKEITEQDARFGYVLTAGMQDGATLLKAINNYRSYFSSQFYAYTKDRSYESQVDYFSKVRSQPVWDWLYFDTGLKKFEKDRLAEAIKTPAKDFSTVRPSTSIADLMLCITTANRKASDSEIPTPQICSESNFFKQPDAAALTKKLQRGEDNQSITTKIMEQIYDRYAPASLEVSRKLKGYIDDDSANLLYSYLPNNFGIASAGKVTFDQMADKLKKEDSILDMIYTYLSFGVWNLIKFTYTALGQEVYTKVFLGHSGNSLFYTPTTDHFSFVNIATISLYFVMAALCIAKMGFDLFRIIFQTMTGKQYMQSLMKFVLIFALPLLAYNYIVDFTFNKTNEAFIKENLYQTAVLDRSVDYDRELITTAPGMAENTDFRDALENYAIQLPVYDENGAFVQKTFGLFDFLNYARNKSLTYDDSPITEAINEQQTKRGFKSVNEDGSLIQYVNMLGTNEENKSFYQQYAKYNETSANGHKTNDLEPGEHTVPDMFNEIYYQYAVYSQVPTGQDPKDLKFDVENFYGSKVRDMIVETINRANFNYQASEDGSVEDSLRDISGLTVVNNTIELYNNEYTSNVISKLEGAGTIRVIDERSDKFVIASGYNADGSLMMNPEKLKLKIEDSLKVDANDATGFNLEQMMNISTVLKDAAASDPFRLGPLDFTACQKNIDASCGVLLTTYSKYLQDKGLIEIVGNGFTLTGDTVEAKQETMAKINDMVTEMNYKLIEDFRKHNLIFDDLKTRDDFVQAENEFLALNTFFYLNDYFEIKDAPKSFYTAGISTDTFLRILMIPMSKFSSTNTDINNVMVYVGMEYDPFTFIVFLIEATIVFTAYSFIKIGVITVAFSFLIVLAALQSIWYKKSRSFVGLIYIFVVFYLIHLGFLVLWKLFTMLNNRYHNFNNDYWLAAPELITSIVFLVYFILVWKFVLIPMYKNIKSDIRNLGGAKVLADINKVWNKTKNWAKDRTRELKERFNDSDSSDESSSSEDGSVSTKESEETTDEKLDQGLTPQTIPNKEPNPRLVEEINNMTNNNTGAGTTETSTTESNSIVPEIADNGTILGDSIPGTALALGAGGAVVDSAKNIMDAMGYTVSQGDDGEIQITGVGEDSVRGIFGKIADGLDSDSEKVADTLDNVKVDSLSEGLNQDVLRSAEKDGLITTTTKEDGTLDYSLTPGTTQEQLDEFVVSETTRKVTGADEVENLAYDTDDEGNTSFIKSDKTKHVLEELKKSGMITDYEEVDGRYEFKKAENVTEEDLNSTLASVNQLITTSTDPRMMALNSQPDGESLTFISGKAEEMGGIITELNNSEKVTEIVKESVGYAEQPSGAITLVNNDISEQILSDAGISNVSAVNGVYTLTGTNADKVQEYMSSVELDYRRTSNEDGEYAISSTDAVTKAVITEIAEQTSASVEVLSNELRDTAEALRQSAESIKVTPITQSVSDGMLSKFSFTMDDEMISNLRDVLAGNVTTNNQHYYTEVKTQLNEIGVTSVEQLYKGDNGEYNMVTRLGTRADQLEKTLVDIQAAPVVEQDKIPSKSGLNANSSLAGNNPAPTGDSAPRSTMDTLARLAGDARN